MASTSQSSNGSFNILGSSKLNTADGKNPAPDVAKANIAEAKEQINQAARSDEYRRQCSKAHNDLEARLRDEELRSRSRGGF